MASNELIDAHQHLWVMSERTYSWIAPEYGPLYDDFTPERLQAEIAPSGVTGSVLVQAADTYDDTFYMLDVAKHSTFVQGVVGWVPFDRPREASTAIETLATNKYIKGFRNLSHDYSNSKYNSDDAWILRPEVLETIAMIENIGLAFDYVAVNDAHIKNVPTLAKKFPKLKIVVDHFAKPDIAGGKFEPWATLMADLARFPNVYAKLSGLNTASGPDWTFKDWLPYVDHIIKSYGVQRVMMGGDWPVCVLNGDYVKVWKAQVDVIAHLPQADQEWIKSKTARAFYNL
jgi:L-fuconolactonase